MLFKHYLHFYLEIYLMKTKYTLFLIISLFFVSLNFAQTNDGEIVISEESIQRLANKLYTLKKARGLNKNENQLFPNEQIEVETLQNIRMMDEKERDTLFYFIEQMLQEEELNKNKPTKYTIVERYVQDTLIVRRSQYVNTSSEGIKLEEDKTGEDKTGEDKTEEVKYIEEEKYNSEEKSNPTEFERNADTKEILQRLTSIESQLNQLKQQQSEPIVVEEAATNTSEDITINTPTNKTIPIILATQIKQNQAIEKTNSKLDSLLILVNLSKNDTLQTTDNRNENAMAEPQNNPSLESLRNQIYLINAKLDKVLNDRIEADAVQKVEAATNLTDTVYISETIKENALDKAYEARKNKYGNYFEQIFFANNSTKVEEKYQDLISSLVQQLNEEPKIDVSIAGFASKTGNKDYNQQISMQRALALKKRLVQEGISSNRILTDYRGIDYEATNLAEARRLDIEFVVRK